MAWNVDKAGLITKKYRDCNQEEKMMILITLLGHKQERQNAHKAELYWKGQS